VRRVAQVASVAAGAALLGAGIFPLASSASSGQVNIIEWVNPPAVTATKAVDAGFQRATGIQANLTTAVSRPTNYAALEKTSVEAGSADIMAVEPLQPYPPGMPTADLGSEALWGVDGVYDALNNQPWVKNMLPASKAAQTYDGKLYGENTGVYQVGIFYNKAIFAKYHLSPPRTLSQYMALSATLKKDHVTPLWYATAGGAVVYDWVLFLDSQLMAQYGNVNVDNLFWAGKAKFTDPQFVAALNNAKEITSTMEPNWQGQNWTGMPGAFASGKAAMHINGVWEVPTMVDLAASHKLGFAWGAVQIPTLFAHPATWADSHSFAIPAATFDQTPPRIPDCTTQRRKQRQRHQLDRATSSLLLASSRAVHSAVVGLERNRASLSGRSRDLARICRYALSEKEQSLSHVRTVLEGFDPKRQLARGWSLTKAVDGRVLRSVAEVSTGEAILTVLADGTVASNVENVSRVEESA
jgi:ABC-type glycerol-3-phosphate transport system substrate-binding protein